MIKKFELQFKIKNTILFLISSFFLSSLIIQFTRMWLIVSCAIILISVICSFRYRNIFLEFKKSSFLTKVISFLCSTVLLIFLIQSFISNWSPSDKLSIVASKIHLSKTGILLVLSIVLAILSLYSLVLFFSIFLSKIKGIKINRCLQVVLAGIIVVVCFNLLVFVFNNKVLNQFCLVLEGVLVNVILYELIVFSVKKAELQLRKHDFIAIVCMIASSFLIYFIIVSLRSSIYVWDFTTYFERMNHLSSEYSDSPFRGIFEWFFSGMQMDYGCFLTMFIYPVYFFSNGSIQSFIFSYFLTCTVPSMIIIYCFGKWSFRLITGIQDKLIHTISLAIIIAVFPLLHSASLQGMPDVFGLTFAGIIVILTLSYDFYSKDYKRWVVIFIATVSIILTRRWYLFFVFGYYSSYFLILLIKTVFAGERKKIVKAVKNIVIFGICSLIAGTIVFDKMINMILKNNYSDSYSSWNTGGFFAEIVNQIQILGVIVSIMVLLGWVIGFLRPTTRYYTMVLLVSNFVSLFLFTRIQNMGHHQSLILFFGYFYGINILLSLLSINLKKFVCIVPVIAIVASAINCICIDSHSILINSIFSSLDLYPHQRMDTDGLDEINGFFDKILLCDEKVQVLAASQEYDSEVFTHYPKPFANEYYYRNNFLAQSGGFPVGFFDAKYILIVNPIQERENVKQEQVLSILLNEFNNNKSVYSHFEKIKTVRLQDRIEAIVYKRIKKTDNDEVKVLMNAFSDYCKKYPEAFQERLKRYIE